MSHFNTEFPAEDQVNFDTEFQSSPCTSEDGATFTPSVSPEGVLSWTNNKKLPNPEPVNIKGNDGESPLVVVKDTDDGHIITITTRDKVVEFTVMNGRDGHGIPGTAVGAEIFNNPDNIASGINSHAEGHGTIASGVYSHAEGNQNTASGNGAHAEGQGTIASNDGAHSEGQGSVANGKYSHAEGFQTNRQMVNGVLQEVTAGESSHAEGKQTRATGNYSHSEGITTTASGIASHAEGESTEAIGRASHSTGVGTKAKGDYSYASGRYTIANGWAQYVIGQYNKEDATQAFIIGGGTSNTDRKNIFTVDKKGNVWLAGELKIGGTGQYDPGVSKTQVENMIAEAIGSVIGGSY